MALQTALRQNVAISCRSSRLTGRCPIGSSLDASRHLRIRRRPRDRCLAVPEDGLGEDLSDFMKQDLERFAAKQQQQQQQASRSYTTQQTDQATSSSPLKETVDKVLIADFFFILVVLAWLGAGLAEKAALRSSTLIDAWMPLWPMVFQPAIGILMAGALVSGGLNWVQEQQQKKQ
eukprot:GHUV01013749.1.p1 GENE.GHUV01013749.1~~GHUV01013749.1.p1  ORF type:complete len:176 (+),score=64.40 GHUV01013749.1:101-628(+)